MFTRILGFVILVAIAVVPAVANEPFELTIDPAQSTANFTLCAVGACDTDISDIAGIFVIDLDDPTSPTQTNLYDFSFDLVSDLNFNIQIFLGAVDVTATDLSLSYPNPGVPFGPTPIVGNMFELINVPAIATGMAEYNASGLACGLISAAGLPCQDTIDLASIGEVTADSIVGEITIDGDLATLVINAEISVPILPDNPDLAQLDFVGTIVATGTIPPKTPGDFDGDGDADLFDFGAFAACESGPGGGIIVPACAVFDFDGDSDVDLGDFADFMVVFTGSL